LHSFILGSKDAKKMLFETVRALNIRRCKMLRVFMKICLTFAPLSINKLQEKDFNAFFAFLST
jgi:hypothetical protein